MGKIDAQEPIITDALPKRRSTVISGKQSAAAAEQTQKRDTIRRISAVLRKSDAERTADDEQLLAAWPALVKHALKLQVRVDQSKQRRLEQEDPYEVLVAKAKQLAEHLSRARHLVCYTGAGISTAARIPDYRGSNGIWTRLQKGEQIGQHDLSAAEPTYTHMALFELHRQRILQYVLSQNCDGLHLRSGLPREALSEVHGNMYVEVCKACRPEREYLRAFDTTELTARYCHKTRRRCGVCAEPLHDTIVHFGERGSLKWPLNWDGASRAANRADVILCLGSSLKVLKKYSWLWQMDRPRGKRPKLCIVNLQWTPKDAFADLKLNGKCDVVMALVMRFMGLEVRPYSRLRDPIFAHATELLEEERHTTTQPMLKWTDGDSADDATEAETDGMADADDESFEEEECCDEDDMDFRLSDEDDGDVSDCSASCVCMVSANAQCKTEADGIKEESTIDEGKTLKGGDGKLPSWPETLSANDAVKPEPDEIENDAKCEKPIVDIMKTPTKSENGAESQLRKAPPTPNFKTSPTGLRTISPQCQRPLQAKTGVATLPAVVFEDPASRLPYWYETKYAYSGLHTIVHPPPMDVLLFRSSTKSVNQLDESRAECAFCFRNYAEFCCQFYARRAANEQHSYAQRSASGRRVVCECCSAGDDAAGASDVGGPMPADNSILARLMTADDADSNSAGTMVEEYESGDPLEQTDDSAEAEANGDGSAAPPEKCSKPNAERANATALATPRIQPGWYGKGYRKSRRRRRM